MWNQVRWSSCVVLVLRIQTGRSCGTMLSTLIRGSWWQSAVRFWFWALILGHVPKQYAKISKCWKWKYKNLLPHIQFETYAVAQQFVVIEHWWLQIVAEKIFQWLWRESFLPRWQLQCEGKVCYLGLWKNLIWGASLMVPPNPSYYSCIAALNQQIV